MNYNAVGITDDTNRHKSTLTNGISIPREILPEKLLFAGVEYSFSDEKKNCVVCDGGEIEVGEGYRSVHLLIASLNGDKKIAFECSGKTVEVTVPDCFEALGEWDLMMLNETGYIKPVPQALALSHTHEKKRNLTAKQFYIFHAEIPLEGESKIKLPVDEETVIFAATAVKKNSVFSKGDLHFDTLEKREFDYEFSDYALKRMSRNKIEKFLDKFIDRTYSISVKIGEFHNKYAFDELYYILRNLCNRITYEKTVEKLIREKRNNEKSN